MADSEATRNYAYYDIPQHLRDKAEEFYGTIGYPPADNSAVWKLLASSTDEKPSYMIENSKNVGIYMISNTTDFQDRENLKTDFKDTRIQPLLVGANQKLLFSKVGFHLYKLIPKVFLDKDLNNVTELKLQIIT